MKERIDIVVADSVLEENGATKVRYDKTLRFEPTDRAPVFAGFYMRSLLEGSGGKFSDLRKNPHEHLRTMIFSRKWRIENVRDDWPIDTKSLIIEPNFGAIRGVEFPIEIIWHGEDTPKSSHPLKEVEDIDKLEIPSPDCGLNAKRIEYYKGMLELVDEFDIRLNGEPLQLKVDLNHPGGPIPSAYALCGSNLFLWMLLDPERVHRLMDITTRSHLQVIEYFDELTGREPGHWVWAGCDTGEMISSDMFSEFVVPYYLKIWEKQGRPRMFHMCGKIDHLLDIILDDLEIDILEHFGFPTDRKLLGEKYSGRVVMRGGPHPALIKDGPVEKIIPECEDYIRTLGRKGGFILAEGATIVPGTPLNHIDAMVEASKRVGNLMDNK
jgi:hypothetical protein